MTGFINCSRVMRQRVCRCPCCIDSERPSWMSDNTIRPSLPRCCCCCCCCHSMLLAYLGRLKDTQALGKSVHPPVRTARTTPYLCRVAFSNLFGFQTGRGRTKRPHCRVILVTPKFNYCSSVLYRRSLTRDNHTDRSSAALDVHLH